MRAVAQNYSCNRNIVIVRLQGRIWKWKANMFSVYQEQIFWAIWSWYCLSIYTNLITMELINISHIVKNDTTNTIYLWYKFFPGIGNTKYMALCTFRSTAHKGWYIYKINDMLHLHYISFSWPLRPVRVKLINLLCRTNWSLISGCIISFLCSRIFGL